MEVEVGRLSDLEPGSATVVEVGETEIAVFNTGEGIYAVDNRCAHRGGPVSKGWVADGIVTCPWHWWRYRLASGQRLGSDRIALRTYQVQVKDGVIVIKAPNLAEEPASIRDRLLQHAQEWSRDQ